MESLRHQKTFPRRSSHASLSYIYQLFTQTLINLFPSPPTMRTLGVLFLLLLSGLADSSNLVTINPALFTLKDAENKHCSATQLGESSFALMHIQGNCSPFRLPNSTWFNAILESIKGDANRYRAITKGRGRLVGDSNNNPQEDADVPLASGQVANTVNYIVKLGFGTPGQSFYTVVDTGSDITWIRCNPCLQCSGQAFEPSKSPTFQYLGCTSEACQQIQAKARSCGKDNCSFIEGYGDGSLLLQVLSSDTLVVGSQSVNNFIFGCAKAMRGLIRSAPGLVGFGRQPLSFVSQTAKLYDSVFSYCLPSLRSSAFTGSLALGKGALSKPGLHFTPLLSNAANPYYYYVGLNGISVGQESVSIPPGTFTMDQSTGKGTIIDSGTVITRLVQPAYNPMRDSFRRQVSNLTLAAPISIFDTCYNIPSGGTVVVPRITLHFQNSMDMVLPAANFLIPLKNQAGSVACLAFALPPADPSSSVISIIGNYQQQNLRVVYDVPRSRLGIVSESCDN